MMKFFITSASRNYGPLASISPRHSKTTPSAPPFSKDCSVMSGIYLRHATCVCVEDLHEMHSYFAGSVSSFSRKTPSSVILA